MDPDLLKQIKSMVKLATLVLILLAVYLLFIYIFPILGNIFSYIPALFLPFILAILLAVIIEPVVEFFERKTRLNRSISVALSLLLGVGGLIALLFLIISKISREMANLSPLLSSYSGKVIEKSLATFSDFKLFYLRLDLSPEIQAAIQDNIEKGIELVRALMENSIDMLMKTLTMLPGLFIFLMIAAVASFFIIKDRALIRSFVLQLFPEDFQSKTRHVVAELFKALIGFAKAYSILISITAIITIICLQILGVQYVFTIGIIVGLLDILPVLGPGGLFIPWIIWEILIGNTGMGISLLVVYIVISVVRQILEPKIVGDSIGLHPLATLVSLYVGLQLGGFAGLVLGPVIVVIVIACFRAGLFKEITWRKD
jgi:sporulation integral membrane protein YtvI